MPTLYQIILTALCAVFIILFLTKIGFREKARNFCDMNGLSIVAKMLDCDFCFSFWTNVIISIIMMTTFNEFSYMLIPIFSTPITRYLL